MALVVLLVALAVLVVKDRDFWFGNSDTTTAEDNTSEWNPNAVVQPATPTIPATKPAVAAKSSAEPVAKHSVIASNRTVSQPIVTRPAVIPPLEVEVIAGDARNSIHLGNSPVKIGAPDSKSEATSTVAVQGPTVAAERVRMSLAKATVPSPESPYPLLGRQMKVQGAVLLKALIGADGFIRDLRVLSGPAILASAAREAARQWQFKPYLQNGQPVETQANITVNFTIKVLDNGVRDTDTVVALSRGGE